MSEQHTPDTRSIRNHWVESAIGAEELAEAHEEFDRWLDQERATARREGQAEAYEMGWADCWEWTQMAPDDQRPQANPYRNGEDRHVDQ